MDWRGVPLEHINVWHQIFSRSREALDLAEPCPVCGAIALHRWYHVRELRARDVNGAFFRGRGGLWQWCSSCGCYEHAQALVPLWWNSDLQVPQTVLTHAPEAIEAARKARVTRGSSSAAG